MTPACRRLILGVALVTVGVTAQAEEIYRVRDTDGSVKLTNLPPPGGKRSSPGKPSTAPSRAPVAKSPRPYTDYVRGVSQRYGLDPNLIHAMIQVESAYDSQAVSPRGAVGLMQLTRATAAEVGIHDLTNPYDNIVAGVRQMHRLLQRYRGDVTLALAAYNAGPGAVERHGGVPPYKETRDYIRRVRERYSGRGMTAMSVTGRDRVYRYKDASGTLVYTQFAPASPARSGGSRP